MSKSNGAVFNQLQREIALHLTTHFMSAFFNRNVSDHRLSLRQVVVFRWLADRRRYWEEQELAYPLLNSLHAHRYHCLAHLRDSYRQHLC